MIDAMPTANCRSCGLPIRWAYTSSAKRIPLDPDPVPGGNLVVVDAHGQVVDAALARSLVARGVASVQVARRGKRSVDPELPHWRSHFATCRYAAGHRHRKVNVDPEGRGVVDVPTQGQLL